MPVVVVAGIAARCPTSAAAAAAALRAWGLPQFRRWALAPGCQCRSFPRAPASRIAVAARGMATETGPGAGGSSSSSGGGKSGAGGGDGAPAGTAARAAGEPLPAGHQMGPDSGEMKRGSDNVQFTWRSTIFTCLIAGGCLWYYEFLIKRKEAEARAITKSERIGKPRLGGPFELLDRKGKTVTDKDFLGQYLLIYFGFTFCPDICPQEMEKQTRAIEILDEEIGPVATPVFISVDPARDTPPQVDEYCQDFHPRLAGLTGSPEQVKRVSRAYRVYYNESIRNSEQDYLIDHSIIHYFMGKNGKFIDFFGKNMTAREMADKMKAAILEDQERAKQRKLRRGVEGVDDDDDA